jgi:DNA-binding transcriptional LysR family regulator
VTAGAALGFLPVMQARALAGLTEALPPRPDWDTPLWLVTHVDLHRTPRIQLFLKALKDDLKRGGLD